MTLLGATTATAALMLAAAPLRAETLNILIWESYIDQEILTAFTTKTGIEINQTFYDSGDQRDEILSDPSSNVDLVVIGETGAHLYGKRGILEQVSQQTVPSLKDYAATWRDRCGEHAVPYLWGTMGILYRSDKITETPHSWADLMEPAASLKGHIAMYDDHKETFVAPLILLGKSINANDMPTLKQAFELLKKQAPSVLTYDYVITSSQNADYGKDIYMAIGYSGDQHVLNDKAGTPGVWRYSVPKEGTLSWLDCMAVTASSPRKTAALQLLDFISSADQAGKNAVALQMPTASTAAMPLLPEEMRTNPEIFATPEILAKSQFQLELSVESIQARRRIISTLANFRDAR
ncbi:polyamine ABC transporter substrate-binding protein [Pararhizobium sp.]|uniref:polyamine ABC transporter substrate-binding protein n=1 Tax=Pararhizobium sp. TaxID=1977563 RepID=UPI003FA6DCDD